MNRSETTADSGAVSLPGGLREQDRQQYETEGNSQNPGAGGTNEGAHCHVDIGRAALVAVEAFPIRGQASHFPEHLQMSLLLLSLRARRHDQEQRVGITGGKKLGQGTGGRAGVPGGRLAANDGGGQADTLLRGLSGRLTNRFFCRETAVQRRAPVTAAPPAGLE